MTFSNFVKKNILLFAWAQSIIATLGSLYFSEIKHFTPCTLCWYQRILMYPLVIIFAIGLSYKDKNLHRYVLALSFPGMIIAAYHTMLQYGILPENIAPCQLGSVCTVRYVGYFGFLTIPLMSTIAFSIITLCMIIYKKINSNQKTTNSNE